ncbi:hypothetical protein JCM18899A_08590 [Nocardioides sp. AN3]
MTDQIDGLAYAGSFLHDAFADFDEKVAAKARQGVRVRLLFGDPQSDAVALRGKEEGIGELMAGRCALNWAYGKPFLETPGIEAREHRSTLYASLYRFDDTLLANTHVLGAAASHSPVRHFRKVVGGRLFDHYLGGFERPWESAKPHVT